MTCTHSKQGTVRRHRARAANKGKGIVHRLASMLGWQKSSMPTSRKMGTNSLVWSSSSGVASIFMALPKHTQVKVGCAGLLHAAVCSSVPQCLELLPPPPIVRVAPQDHPVHLLAATWHGCARSEQKHELAQVRCVGPLCAVASRSAARAIHIRHPLCWCCAIF